MRPCGCQRADFPYGAGVMLRCVMFAGLIVGAHGDEKGLVASETLPGVSLPEGVNARVVADHDSQGVTSPTALSEDRHGRWYLAETLRFRAGVEDNRTHPYWLTEDGSAKTTADRAAMYKKWADKFEEGYFTEKSERIRVLADQGEDGRFAKSEIFAADFDDPLAGTASGVLAYDDVVYFACIPEITALADSDGDLRADQRLTLQDGFGVRVSYSGHDMNGFVLGPDGRIWGTIGDRGFALTTREGKRYEFPDQGAVFRFDPDGSNFEVVHTGLRNPKEVAFDAQGNPVTVDNNADQGDHARVVYVVEGGDSGWRMGHQMLMSFGDKIGAGDSARSAWMEEKRWETRNDAQPAFMLPPVAHLTNGPSGLDFHPGTGFTKEEEGRFVVCDYKASPALSGLLSFKLEEEGSSLELVDSRKLAWGITASDVSYSWDGRLMVADFGGGWVSHEGGSVIELSVVDRFRAEAADEVARAVREGLEDASTEQLAEWLKHPDMRLRIRAQLELTRRQDGLEPLVRAAMKGAGIERLHGIWGLGVYLRRGGAAKATAERDEFADIPGSSGQRELLPVLLQLVRDPNAEVRAQTAKVLGDIGPLGDVANFGALILDESPRVRLFGTIATGKAEAVGSMTFIWQMLEENGEDDPYLRHAGAMALARLSTPLQLFTLNDHPSVGVRLAAVNALAAKKDRGIEAFLGDPEMRVFQEVVRTIHDGNLEASRERLAERVAKGIPYDLDGMTWRRLIHNAVHLGGEAQLEWLASLPMERSLPKDLRREALRALSIWDAPPLLDGATGSALPPRMDGRAEVKEVLTPMIDAFTRVQPGVLAQAIRLVEKLGLDDSGVPTARWMELVENSNLPDDARAAALDRWLARDEPERVARLAEIAKNKSGDLALAALERLAAIAPGEAAEAVKKATESDDTRRRKAGWRIASRLGGEAMASVVAEGVKRLTEAGGRDPAGLELLDAAEASKSSEVAEAVAAYRAAIEADEDPLAAWRVSLEGGDPDRGKHLFFSDGRAQCSKCHRVGGDFGVGEAGPDLEGIGALRDESYLLESLVLPQAKVAPGFGMVTVTMKDGSVAGGVLMTEDEKSVVIDVAGERKLLPREDIVEMGKPISVMPPMGAILNRREIRDLVAWLATLEPGER